MSVIEEIPGMVPGETRRNVLLGLLYFSLLPFTLPLGIGLLVAKHDGLADRLSGLPGVSTGGGYTTIAAVAVYAFVILMIIGAGAQVAPSTTGEISEPGGASAGAPTATPTDTAVTQTTATRSSQPSSTATGTAEQSAATRTPTEGSDPPVTATTTAASENTQPATSTATSSSQSSYRVQIVDVVDGDTMDIRFQNGSTDTIRLLGVDTPEVNAENDPAEYEGVPNTAAGSECLRREGRDASQFATDRLASETVTVVLDEQADTRGSYGRLLGYVEVDGTPFNYQLLSEGHARVYDSTFSRSDRFYTAESDAQSAQRGVWTCRDVSTPTATPSSESGGALDVAAVHADARGNDHDNLDEEYIVFENTGASALDISGWTVRDEADHDYVVPSGTTLDPGEEITLYTGSSGGASSDLYWGSGSAVWNNGGDTIYVADDSGATRIAHEYE